MTPTLRTRASLSSLLVALLVLGGCASQDTAPSGDAETPAQTQQQQPADALSALRSQANRGDMDSQFQLGSAYFIGNAPAAQAPPGAPTPPADNPPRDLKQAEYWWKQAADRGHSMAAVSLAYLYTGRDNPEFANQQAMLKILALTVRGKARRPRDLAARYGGEEFVALLPNTPLEHAIDIAERIRQAVVGLHAQHEDNEGGIVTVSIGVATAVPRPGDEVAALVEAADAAVYRAKEAGRNRVVAAGP